jgi:DNA-binding transcriptional LysR family regulator
LLLSIDHFDESPTMITELRTFIAVVRYGTFAAAGERIGLTQSAISSQIKRLEQSLGVSLFDRTRRAAVLNATGALTLARAEEIVALYARLGDPPTQGDAEGLMRIGAIASVQSSLLPRAMAAMRGTYPKLRLNVVPGVSMHLIDQLDAGELDMVVAIRPPFGLPPELVWQPLLQEPFKLVVPAAVKGRDWRKLIETQPLMRYERKSFGGRLVEKFLRAQRIQPIDSIELDEIQGLIQLVANGLGVALIPMTEAHLPLPAAVRAVPLGEHTFHREIGILMGKAKASGPMHSELARCLHAQAPR